MNELKKINRKFFRNLMIMVGIIVAAIVGLVLVYSNIEDENIRFPVALLVFIGLIVGGGLFKNKLDRITNMAYLIRIRENQAEPLPIHKLKDFNSTVDLFRKNGFQTYQKNETYTIYYKCELDHIKQIFRNNILTVMVLINNKNTDFYLNRVDDEINKLRDELFKDKKKVNRVIITQIKEIDDLNTI